MRLRQQSRRNTNLHITPVRYNKYPTKPYPYHPLTSQLRHNPDPATAENSLKSPNSHPSTSNPLPFHLPFIFFRDPFLSHEKLWWCSGYHIPKVFVHVALDCAQGWQKYTEGRRFESCPWCSSSSLWVLIHSQRGRGFFVGCDLLRERGTCLVGCVGTGESFLTNGGNDSSTFGL